VPVKRAAAVVVFIIIIIIIIILPCAARVFVLCGGDYTTTTTVAAAFDRQNAFRVHETHRPGGHAMVVVADAAAAVCASVQINN